MSDLVPIIVSAPAGASPFDAIRRTRPDGCEFWSARDLMIPLGYDTWRSFEDVLDRARAASKNAGYDPADHFLPAPAKSTGGRPGMDFDLTRRGAYYTAMNGDPRKPEVAAAQTYFVEQTRRAELASAPAVAPAPVEDHIITTLKMALETRQAQLALEKQVAETRRIALAAMDVAENNGGLYAVLGWFRLRGESLDNNMASLLGKRLTAICKARNLPIGSANHPLWGYVHTYPESVLTELIGPRQRPI
jgi:DNA-damage-inducible protein D